jgi:dipeptidyl aminopeptidase/acylaminoacyl peptidase
MQLTATVKAELPGGDEDFPKHQAWIPETAPLPLRSTPKEHPGEVYVADMRRGRISAADPSQRLAESETELGEQSSITWKGADDLEIEGILVKPVGYEEGTRYPLAILPHGGPEGISMNGWNTRPLYPDTGGWPMRVCGASSRTTAAAADAERHSPHPITATWEARSLMMYCSASTHLDEEGLIDPDRVGISGTSYGGYFAAWAATRHSDRFAAGITFAGLSNWISFMGTTDIPHEMSVVHWDLYWFDNPGQNWERSPVAWLNQADTPLLVATGLADERVHPEQALQLHQFLEMKGIPTGLILYPRSRTDSPNGPISSTLWSG